MSDRVKYIIGELNKGPFNRNYNVISFDSLSPEDLLQVLTDVLAELDEDHRIDIRGEEPEETTIRLLTMLRLLKYSPGPDPVGFRQGLVQGDKAVVQPILEWLLTNMAELKTRAYLGRYLVKLEIPLEALSDPSTAALYQQYEANQEEFKAVHKEYLELKKQSNTTQEMRSDIEAMQKEKDIVIKRVERLNRKLEGMENKEELMDAVGKLWSERERQKSLARQREEEFLEVESLQQTCATLAQTIQKLRETNLNREQKIGTPQELIKQLNEEILLTEYIVEEKLPSEIEHLKYEIELLSRVASTSPYTQEMIDSLHDQIREMKEAERAWKTTEDESEADELGGSGGGGGDNDKLAMFRQQAAIVAKRKEQLANVYTQTKLEHDSLLQTIKMKDEEGMLDSDDATNMTESELKELIERVKIRSTVYKQKKAELAALVAETGILARTLDILKISAEEVTTAASGGPTKSRQEEEEENLPKDAIVGQLERINGDIAAYKNKLSPVLRELRKVKDQYLSNLEEYNEKKQIYETTAARLERDVIKVEKIVKDMQKEIESKESEIAIHEAKSDILQALIDRTEQHETVRDALTKRIAEREAAHQDLKEKSIEAKKMEAHVTHQRDLLNNLIALLECKEECMERAKEKDGIVTRDDVAETLVLQ